MKIDKVMWTPLAELLKERLVLGNMTSMRQEEQWRWQC